MKGRVVLDASAAANIAMRTNIALDLIERLEDFVVVFAPELFQAEIANTLWKYVVAGDIDAQTALFRYEEAVELIDTFEADRDLITEALVAATTYNHPVYDMLYAVLARRYGCSVITVDKRLGALLEKMGIALT